MGGGKSKSKSGAQYQDKVFQEQIPFLQNLYGAAENTFQDTMGMASAAIPGAQQQMLEAQQATQPAWNQQLGGGVYQDMGLQNSLMNSLNQSLNNPSAMSEINGMIMGGSGNNYADAMKTAYMRDAQNAQNQMLSTLDARAAASGMSGGARHGLAVAGGMQGINDNLQRNLAETGFNTFDKDLDRKLAIAGMADQNTLARQQMMSTMLGDMQNTQNAGISGGLQQQQMAMGQFSPMMMPWNMMGEYANVIGRPTILGSGNQSGSSKSKGFSF